MRLSDLSATLAHPDNANPTLAQAWGIKFKCPGCVGTPHEHEIWAPFVGRSSGAAWTPTGTSLEDLSFIDAPQGSRSIRVTEYPGSCRSHFNIVNGGIEFYGDSGHTAPRQ